MNNSIDVVPFEQAKKMMDACLKEAGYDDSMYRLLSSWYDSRLDPNHEAMLAQPEKVGIFWKGNMDPSSSEFKKAHKTCHRAYTLVYPDTPCYECWSDGDWDKSMNCSHR